MHHIAPLNPAIEDIEEVLMALFRKRSGYSAIDTARSEFSLIIQSLSNCPIGEHPLMCQLMKDASIRKPSL